MRIVSVASLCLAISGLASAAPVAAPTPSPNPKSSGTLQVRQEGGTLETATVSRTVTVTEGSHTKVVYATITETVDLVDPVVGFQLAIATVTDARFAAEPAPSTTTIEVIETVTVPAEADLITTVTQTVIVTRTSAPGATTTTTTTIFVDPSSATPSNSAGDQSTTISSGVVSSISPSSSATSVIPPSSTSNNTISETAPTSTSSPTSTSESDSDATSTMAPSSSSSRLSTDELAGLIAGILVFVIVATTIGIMFWHRYRHPVEPYPPPPTAAAPAAPSMTPPPLPADDPGILGSPAVTGPGLPGWPTAAQIRIPVRAHPHPKRRTQSSELSPFGYLPTVNERAPTPAFRSSMMDLPEEESAQDTSRRRSVGDIGMAIPMSSERGGSRFSTMRV
ncbi:hypothetical protein HYQ45_011842 [Verticillium longisporum]|uniref:Mid2 domain-containing protein n=1 Tax=Verticillium longisporum TaxID=100787 RepID=A0A8I2ZDJ8_VERLO|nr:hypothetical protein HYQ45_011842 [Verticillium longisporum]